VTALGTQRGLLGAYQNQIEYTVSNVTELSSNLSAARSRVTDTDYAAETAALTKGQILQQASTAMLAQANQMPNVILTLLK
jgi:flagellin